ASDIALKRESHQIELQLDVLIESFRHAGRHIHGRRRRRRLRRDVETPLDLTNIFGVLIEPGTIARADIPAKPAPGCASPYPERFAAGAFERSALPNRCRRRTGVRTPPAD